MLPNLTPHKGNFFLQWQFTCTWSDTTSQRNTFASKSSRAKVLYEPNSKHGSSYSATTVSKKKKIKIVLGVQLLSIQYFIETDTHRMWRVRIHNGNSARTGQISDFHYYPSWLVSRLHSSNGRETSDHI